MAHLFELREDQMKRVRPSFPKESVVARVDDQKVLSGIIHFIQKDLRWIGASAAYGSHKRC